VKIIPAIDLMDGQVVRLFKGDPRKKTVYFSEPVGVAKRWQEDGADMIHIVDLDATLGRGDNFELIKNISDEISIPIETAGGLRDESKIIDAAQFSSRVVLGTIAFKDVETLKKLQDILGSAKIVISLDHIDGIVVVNGWQKSTNVKLFDAMNNFMSMGFSEFLITNVNRDGTMQGPDIVNLKKACKANVNVIASGGISGIDDVKAVKQTNAFGVILGKALYENKISIQEAKKVS
jgi:phosphoribosylformimino-5-aminoimidazole carboxamide ribotide isomerase